MEDSSLDLIDIGEILDRVNGEVVGTTEPNYGMNFVLLYVGMSGQRLIDTMNTNLNSIDAQFKNNKEELDKRIISLQVKDIKYENNKLYFSLDGENYIPMQAEWGKIDGSLNNQDDLRQALAGKVSTATFNVLESAVNDNSSAILILQGNVSGLQNSVSTLENQVNGVTGILVRLGNVETALNHKINSQSVVEIRTVNGTALEFTTDGTTWHPVSSAGIVEWGDIVGDIVNQSDLQLKLSDINSDITLINNAIDGLQDDMDDVPGLISTAKGEVEQDLTDAETRLNNKIEQETKYFKSVSQLEYEGILTKDSDTLYFINDM